MIFDFDPAGRGGDDDLVASIVSFDNDRDTIILKYNSGKTVIRKGGTIAWRHNNPGNLKYGPFAQGMGALGAGEGKHAVFPSYLAGKRAMTQLIFKNKFYDKTIQEMIDVYAPADDGNDPIAYGNYVASKTGVHPSTALCDLNTEQAVKMIEAMCAMEGYKAGEEIIV